MGHHHPKRSRCLSASNECDRPLAAIGNTVTCSFGEEQGSGVRLGPNSKYIVRTVLTKLVRVVQVLQDPVIIDLGQNNV